MDDGPAKNRIETLKAELVTLRQADTEYFKTKYRNTMQRQQHEHRILRVERILAELSAMSKRKNQ